MPVEQVMLFRLTPGAIGMGCRFDYMDPDKSVGDHIELLGSTGCGDAISGWEYHNPYIYVFMAYNRNPTLIDDATRDAPMAGPMPPEPEEEETGPKPFKYELKATPFQDTEYGQRLIFVKIFCPTTQKITMLGSVLMKSNQMLSDMMGHTEIQDQFAAAVSDENVIYPESFELEHPEFDYYREQANRDLVQIRNGHNTSFLANTIPTGTIIVAQISTEASRQHKDVSPREEGSIYEEVDGLPVYPCHTVAQFAKQEHNTVEFAITLHDPQSPIVIDGVIANGKYTPVEEKLNLKNISGI